MPIVTGLAAEAISLAFKRSATPDAFTFPTSHEPTIGGGYDIYGKSAGSA